jgi:hypothetical protein
MTLRSIGDAGNWKRDRELALCRELALERVYGLALRQTTEWMSLQPIFSTLING